MQDLFETPFVNVTKQGPFYMKANIVLIKFE